MWKLSSYGRHIGIQDGRHIIRHAVFHDREMSLTLSVVTEKAVISPFCSDHSHIQFHDDGCLPVLFNVIEHTMISVHLS